MSIARPPLIAALLLAIVSLSAASPAASSEAPNASRVCHSISYAGHTYPVRVLRGAVRCARARRVLRHFFRSSDRQFNGWSCFLGHGQDIWSGTCARGSGPGRKVVRAYNPSS